MPEVVARLGRVVGIAREVESVGLAMHQRVEREAVALAIRPQEVWEAWAALAIQPLEGWEVGALASRSQEVEGLLVAGR